MPMLTTVYWRDIPAQVIVKQGRKNAKVQLEERFEKAIDMAAMKDGAAGTDDYLADWRRGEPESIEGDDLDAIAAEAAAKLHADFDNDRLKELIANGGRAA